MTYRLDNKRPLEASLKTTALAQLTRAEAAANGGDEALITRIHSLRKSMKKLRALLRLARPGLRPVFAPENAEFRRIAKAFSEIRDAQVMRASVDHLTESSGLDLQALALWAEERESRLLMDHAVADQLADTVQAVAAARDRVSRWRLSGKSRKTLEKGLRDTHSRARKAHAAAHQNPTPEARHEWRKWLKYHWYHCRLLRDAWPVAMRQRILSLEDLTEALGLEHDLWTLKAVLLDDRSTPLPDTLRAAAVAEADAAARRFGKEADSHAKRLMLEDSDALGLRISMLWRL